ncbi:hypothetical protein [Streptomyces sp. NPDC057403]|uniref:hypothetical protein n=1 Tax=Streptomyces sp. NPDC057403 TaxID=3346119 RepID=UPI00367A823C
MARIAENRQIICLRVRAMLQATGVQCDVVIGTMILRAGERGGWLWQTWHEGGGSFRHDEAALVRAAQWEIVSLRRDGDRYAARHRPLAEGQEPEGGSVSADPAELWEEARGHRAEILAAAEPAGLTDLELFLVTAVLDQGDTDGYAAVDALLLARIVAQSEPPPGAPQLAQRRRAILSRAARKLRDYFAGETEGGQVGA